MKVAFVGCGHGQLDLIYSHLTGYDVDLVVICGDFEVCFITITFRNKYK